MTTTTYATATSAIALPRTASVGKQGIAIWRSGIVAAGTWALAGAITVLWPDSDEWDYSVLFGSLILAAATALAILSGAAPRFPSLFPRVKSFGPWLIALGIGLSLWEGFTAKTGLLPRPLFVTPQEMFGVYLDDWSKLLDCVYHSVLLLVTGYVAGALAGFATGVALGWSKTAGYWGHPVLRLIGPLPATAWLPIAFFIFPSSWSAAVFLIALASGIPVAILTWSGVASVGGAYYDIARTLGASQRFLVTKVAIPAAMPSVFVGLFMGLCSAFAVLVVAEMMGVKAGLGWYLQWAQGWAAYGNMYAALAVMALMCSGLVTLLFHLRGHLLAWQKGLLRW